MSTSSIAAQSLLLKQKKKLGELDMIRPGTMKDLNREIIVPLVWQPTDQH